MRRTGASTTTVPTSKVIQTLLAVMLLTLLGATPAVAEDAVLTETVDLNLVVTGGTGTSSTAVPVLPGLVPVSLATEITGGTGAATAGGRYELRVGNSTAQVDSRTGGPVTLALNADSLRDGFLDATLTASILDENGCADPDVEGLVTASVRQATITYSGVPIRPTSLADFTSPAVKNVALLTDPADAAFTAPAVLQAAAALGATYPRLNITTTRPSTPSPYDRIFTFVPGAGPVQVELDVAAPTPTAVLTGDPTALTAAAAALGSPDLALATSSQAADLGQSGQPANSLTRQWADVGSTNPRLSGTGTFSESVSIPQSEFGQPVNSLDITLKGTHIPTAPGATTTASLLVNDRLLASVLLGDTDNFTLTGKVAPDAMQRSNRVTLQIEAYPPNGDCRSQRIPARVDLDPYASTITATAGQSLPPGFARFPQVLGHELPVAFAKGPNPTDLNNAVAVVAAVARFDTVTPTVTVPAATDFINSDQSGFIVNAGPEESTALKAPLPYDPTRAPVSDPPQFTVTIDAPFAALEAFQNGARDVIMLGSYPAADAAAAQVLQDELAAFVAPAPGGWGDATGNVVFNGGADSGPVALNLGQVTNETTPAAADSGGVPGWLWAVGLLLLLLLMLAGVIAALARRHRGSSAASDAPDPSTSRDPSDQ